MELTIGQLIKIILGVLVFVAVVAGVYLFFKNNVFEFFRTENSTGAMGVILSLI
jgi:hypothetical protein